MDSNYKSNNCNSTFFATVIAVAKSSCSETNKSKCNKLQKLFTSNSCKPMNCSYGYIMGTIEEFSVTGRISQVQKEDQIPGLSHKEDVVICQ